MYPVQNADGGSVLQTARNYPIDATTEIQAGAVVKLSAGKVVLAAAAETGGILGIAAEFHSGKEDALNLRANGEWIRVCDNPTLIFECAAPTIKAASGSATTIVPATGDVDASAADDAFNNAVLVLKEKAANSGNTDALGTQIVAFALERADLGVNGNAFVNKRQLFVLEFLFDVFFDNVGIFSDKSNV